MKSEVLGGVILAMLLATAVSAVPVTQIEYEATDLGSGRWQYSYDVSNFELGGDGIEEFTIWFDYGLYDNLSVVTPAPSGWEPIVWDPEPVLHDDGAYDAKTSGLGIGISQNVYGFAVSFDWLGGIEGPSSQFYEIIDPVTFETIDYDYTVPEPTTLFLLCLGSTALGRRKSAKNS